MNFHKVDFIPGYYGGGKGYRVTKLYAKLTEFVDLEVPVVKVTSWEQDYKSVKTAQESVRACARRFKLPVKAVTRSNKDLYLIRTDM